METPSSCKRVTRSQALAASKNIPRAKKDESEKVLPPSSRKRNTNRTVLLDLTNDSPIVGLAMESMDTPSSVAKNSSQAKRTPGSGEALLRRQVKNLLQKIEGGGILKLPLQQSSFPHFQALSDSPSLRLLAPTPANTPLFANIADLDFIYTKVDETSNTSQASNDVLIQVEPVESPESPVTRALRFDSPGKSDISNSSAISYEIPYGGSLKSVEHNSASGWSVQANASSQENEIEEVDDEESEICNFEEEDEEGMGLGGEIDELCQGVSKICVKDGKGMAVIGGRHTRFLYNSDDEIEGEEEVASSVSPSVLRLNGLPTPKGKHLRFIEEEDEE